MAHAIAAGRPDLQAMIDYMYAATKRQEAKDQPVKVAIASATSAQRQLVQSVCGVQFVHTLPPLFERFKQRCIQQQQQQQQQSHSASINKFVWTGDEDTPEELERLKLRLQALAGWETFPSDMEFRDLHTQTLFHVRFEHGSRRVEIKGMQTLLSVKSPSLSSWS